MATVFVPAPLRRLTGGQTRLAIAAGSVAELLDRLEAIHPGVRGYLLDETGALRAHVNLFVGANEVRTLAGLQTPLADDDEVSIIPAMAGGAEICDATPADPVREVIARMKVHDISQLPVLDHLARRMGR